MLDWQQVDVCDLQEGQKHYVHYYYFNIKTLNVVVVVVSTKTDAYH